jgi:uncharacterized protein
LTEGRLLLAGMIVAGAVVVAAGAHYQSLQPVVAARSVVDQAGLMTPEQGASVAAYHERLLADHDIDYRVLTAAAPDIDTFSHDAFAELGVGGSSASGRGLLLVIDPGTDRLRLEVAASLEGVFTDAFVAYLQQRQMVPFFESGRVADGILATTELIFARAQEAEAGRAFDPEAGESFSAGGGAATAARIGAGVVRAPVERLEDLAPQATPEATVTAYLDAMARRNGRPDLGIYSGDTQAMLRSWTVTPAQMDDVARSYSKCRDAETRYSDGGDLAVIRYAAGDRQCAPWFLRRQATRWVLDLTTSQQAVRFNHRNQWRFADPDGHAYAFAFADWRFDRHGFPVVGR